MKTRNGRKFIKVNNYENELNDLNRVLFQFVLETRATYATMSIEDYDKRHHTRRDLEKLEKMLELGSSTEVKRLMMFMSESSRKMVPDSVLDLIK